MPSPMRWTTRGAAVLLLVATGGWTPTRAEDPPPARCCFNNPGYAGSCEVQPAKDETCRQILQYLNNPMAQGKTYCNNTTIRRKWKSVACAAK